MTHLRIGDLARLGGVSVRMLRHYHEIDLLVPAAVDPHTGYRLYGTDQLDELRVIAMLRSVGVSLADIADATRGPDALRAVLDGRRTELAAEIERSRTHLDTIDHHIAELENHTMSPRTTTPIDVELKPIPSRLVAQLSAIAESWAPTDIGPVIQPLYPELIARMERANVAIAGPSTAWYEDTDEGRVHVHATLTIAERPAPGADLDFEIVALPEVPLAATTIHRGTMDNCDDTYQALLTWLQAHGHQPIGYSRELDIECGPDQEWVTELQQSIET